MAARLTTSDLAWYWDGDAAIGRSSIAIAIVDAISCRAAYCPGGF
jgi:hypothetical protein